MQFGVHHLARLISYAVVPILEFGIIFAHGSEIKTHHHHTYHKGECEKCVEIIRNSFAEQRQTVFTGGNKARHRRCPARYGRNDAHRSRRRVDEISQFFACYAIALGYGAHHRAHSEAVEIVIDKNHYAQNDGGKLCPAAGLYVLHRPAPECNRPACLIHQRHHCSQHHQKHQYAHIPRVGEAMYQAIRLGFIALSHRIVKHVTQKAVDARACRHTEERSPEYDSHKQRRIHFLGLQSKADSHYRRQQRPHTACYIYIHRQFSLKLIFLLGLMQFITEKKDDGAVILFHG